jgi:hypothetical protein
VRTHPVDKLLEQRCYKSAAGLLQLVRFYVCTTIFKQESNLYDVTQLKDIRSDDELYFQILKCISQLELAQLIGTGVKTRYLHTGASGVTNSGTAPASSGRTAYDVTSGR